MRCELTVAFCVVVGNVVWFGGGQPQVKDIGSYHGTYFQAGGQRLVPHKPYQLVDGSVLEFGKSVTKDDKVRARETVACRG